MVSIGQGSGKDTSSSNQEVWNAQSPYLTDLYGRSQQTGATQPDALNAYSNEFTSRNMPNAQKNIDTMSNNNYTQDVMSGNNLGMQTFGSLMDPQGNPYLDQQITDMKTGMADNMNIFGMGDNRSEAQMAGQFGSDRHGIDDYLTRKDTVDRATEAEVSMRSGNYQNDMDRSMNAATGYVNSGMNANNQLYNNSNATINAMNSTYNLGMNPFNAEWMPMQNESDIYGNPLTLSSGSSYGQNSSFNAGVGS